MGYSYFLKTLIFKTKITLGDISNILNITLKGYGQVKDEYRIKTRDFNNYTNTVLTIYDKDIYNQIRKNIFSNH